MKRFLICIAVGVLLVGAPRALAVPASTAFTYQGQLTQAGSPMNGTVSLSVRLFDAASGGTLVGAVQTLSSVPVSDGLFTIVLNDVGQFGANAFDGSARWLEITVNGTALSPRQAVTAAPYALKVPGVTGYSLSAADGSPADVVYVDNAGNVGVGTTAPQRLLHLASANNPELRIQDTSAGGKTFHVGINSVDNSLRIAETGVADRVVISATGNVGINTASPTSPLSVKDAPSGDLISLRNSNDSERWRLRLAGNNLEFYDPGNNLARVSLGGSSSTAMTVSGTTRTNVLEILGGSDIAEPFNVNEDFRDQGCGPQTRVAPGLVVSIDPDRVGELRLSSKAYDRAVAGVISGAGGVNVGLSLKQAGSAADGSQPVALTGRVWCWCDADANGSIQAGDLLTTSATPGHAMRVTDHDQGPGATIGKAMSSLASGKGMVLVLVNLQ